ncbi:MAG: histidine ammonia-lyase [Candidatus Azotimanducaceae bacterium]|jgi:histidine ammonia-lyase
MLDTIISSSKDAITLDGVSLTCAQLVSAANQKNKVTLPKDAIDRIISGWKVVQSIVSSGTPGYGITTGVGSQKDFSIAAKSMQDYNRRLAQAHATHAGGAILPKSRVRAALIILVNEFSLGLSGVSEPLVQLIVNQINTSSMPEVSSYGTVGAADLIPMSQIASWLQKKPEAQQHGIPGPKETLSLINTNAITLATGAEVLMDARALLDLANLSLAFSLEAFRGNLNSISEKVNLAHQRCGQSQISAEIRHLLKNSALWQVGAARRIQDPLSFRCATQIHGALQELLDRAIEVWDQELNSVTDNPIVDVEDQCVRSHGNMDSTRMTLAIDGVRQAFAKTIDIAGERLHKQQWTEFSGLPTGFSDKDSPFGGVQFLNLGHLASSFITSIKIWAAPSLLFSVGQLADGVEDTASHALHSVADFERILEAARLVLTIEIIISVWAIQKRGLPTSTLGEDLRPYVEKITPMLPIGKEGIDVFSIEPIVHVLLSAMKK